MRFSPMLLAVPALLACAAITGCHTAQHVSYEPDGSAVATEAPVYAPVTHDATQPAVEVIKEQPAPAAKPVAKPVEPAPAPKAVESKPVETKAVESKPAESKPAASTKSHKEHKDAASTVKTPPCDYVVQKGDTLQKISRKHYGTNKNWPAIMKASKLKDDHIRVGQKLHIPAVR